MACDQVGASAFHRSGTLPSVISVASRLAVPEDQAEIVALYQALEAEMVGLHRMWPLADGLADPVAESVRRGLVDTSQVWCLGSLDGVAFGFAQATIGPLLPRADGVLLGSIRLIYTASEAREVGVGEAMLANLSEELELRGVGKFDAHVLPGHRLVKNFFEAAGFAARSIVMHRRDG